MSACTNATCVRLEAEEAEDAAAAQVAVVAFVAVAVGTFLLLCCGIHAHLQRVSKRRQAQAHRTYQQSAPVTSGASQRRQSRAAADEAVSSEVHRGSTSLTDDDVLATRAAATLGTAQEAARRVRRSVVATGQVVGIFGFFVLPPVMLVLCFNGQAFGHVGGAAVILLSISGVATADPTMPRSTRSGQLGFFTTFIQPFFASLLSGLAAYISLTPQFVGPAARAAVYFCVAGALTNVFVLIAPLLPTLYATRERALPPVAELLKRQRQVIAEDGGRHPCHLRADPMYLLEGAGYYAMPVHAALDHFFAVCQVFGAVAGAILIAGAVAFDALGVPAFITWGSLLPVGLAFLVGSTTIDSRPVRRTVLKWLGRLGSRGEERQAAAVAALMGAYSPAKALATGRATFRGLPFGALTAADLESNADTGLHQRTIKLALGACDAFTSHSWHDDADTKWAALQAWARRFEAAKGRSPILWLDKACINQQDVAASLACLPVYLAGCQRLLVLSGKTYKERLWCVVEVFTFVRMGGALERVEITPLDTAADLGFETFAVENAKCFDDNDKAKLLTAIEAAFGAYAPFNTLVRGLLVGASCGVVAPEPTRSTADELSV